MLLKNLTTEQVKDWLSKKAEEILKYYKSDLDYDIKTIDEVISNKESVTSLLWFVRESGTHMFIIPADDGKPEERFNAWNHANNIINCWSKTEQFMFIYFKTLNTWDIIDCNRSEIAAMCKIATNIYNKYKRLQAR